MSIIRTAEDVAIGVADPELAAKRWLLSAAGKAFMSRVSVRAMQSGGIVATLRGDEAKLAELTARAVAAEIERIPEDIWHYIKHHFGL